MRGLIDNAATQEHQIAMIWKAIEQLNCQRQVASIVPLDAATQEHFEADKLNNLVGK
jgi:serine O-acetyltransferase